MVSEPFYQTVVNRGEIRQTVIILLGATGYVGQAFALELRRRKWEHLACSRSEFDYTRFDVLRELLRKKRPNFLINAAGYTGKPNVDACEDNKAETLAGNTLFPLTVAHACTEAAIPWGHVSSGCIYTGSKLLSGEASRVVPDLNRPEIRALIERSPEVVAGFTERDEPNFSFRTQPCSFYSGTKALAEEALKPFENCYIWRLRIPFDEFDNSRNYLSKLQRYDRVYDNVNSLSHRGDYVRACLDSWERRVPFGTYNVTNPGFVTAQQVVALIRRTLPSAREFEFWSNDNDFYCKAARTPRSNCVLSTAKLAAAGVSMRPVEVALLESLQRWRPEYLQPQ